MVCWDQHQVEKIIKNIEGFKSKAQMGLKVAEERDDAGTAAVFEEIVDNLDKNVQYLKDKITLMKIRKEKTTCFDWPPKR